MPDPVLITQGTDGKLTGDKVQNGMVHVAEGLAGGLGGTAALYFTKANKRDIMWAAGAYALANIAIHAYNANGSVKLDATSSYLNKFEKKTDSDPTKTLTGIPYKVLVGGKTVSAATALTGDDIKMQVISTDVALSALAMIAVSYYKRLNMMQILAGTAGAVLGTQAMLVYGKSYDNY